MRGSGTASGRTTSTRLVGKSSELEEFPCAPLPSSTVGDRVAAVELALPNVTVLVPVIKIGAVFNVPTGYDYIETLCRSAAERLPPDMSRGWHSGSSGTWRRQLARQSSSGESGQAAVDWGGGRFYHHVALGWLGLHHSRTCPSA